MEQVRSVGVGAAAKLWTMRALGSFTALLVGCGSAATQDASPQQDASLDVAQDAAASAGDAAAQDSGRIEATRPDRPRECPATMPIADTFNWAPPRVRRGSCTTEQIRQLASAIATTPINEASYRALVGDACYECAISHPVADATWGAVLRQSEFNVYSYGNVGGCMIAAGASVACGIAANNYGRCAFAACDGCGIADLQTCTADPSIYAQNGPCYAARIAYQRACANTNTQFQRCYGPDGTTEEQWTVLIATELCGPVADAGM